MPGGESSQLGLFEHSSVSIRENFPHPKLSGAGW